MERVFKWYKPSELLPDNHEMVHFDDNNKIMHLGRFFKKDQWDRENVFVSTEGAFYNLDKIDAWIPIQKRVINRRLAVRIDQLRELSLSQIKEGSLHNYETTMALINELEYWRTIFEP